MEINFLILLAATAIPMVLGMIWYSPSIGFGKAWMRESGVTMESAKKTNMALVFGLSTLFSFFVAFMLQSIVIHQFSVMGLLMTQPDSSDPNGPSATMLRTFLDNYGTSYRTFKHGAFHGTLAGLFLALPITGVHALFENKSFKYVAINSGYWIVSMALMGGVICAFT